MICCRCQGTGRYLGNGMMMTDCTLCTGDKPAKAKKVTINRHAKSYHKAINDIMALNPDTTRAEAVKMFDMAYEKD